MFGMMIVVLTNYKPRKYLDVLAEVHILAARRDDKVETLLAPPDAVPGDLVYVDGYGRHPFDVIYPGKKIFQKVAQECTTNMDKEACYKTFVWRVPNKGAITVPTLVNAFIK